jgi:hypothetical protein
MKEFIGLCDGFPMSTELFFTVHCIAIFDVISFLTITILSLLTVTSISLSFQTIKRSKFAGITLKLLSILQSKNQSNIHGILQNINEMFKTINHFFELKLRRVQGHHPTPYNKVILVIMSFKLEIKFTVYN